MLTLVTVPVTEPLTATDFQTSLGIDPSDSAVSSLLNSLITSAREQAETFTSRGFITQSWKLNLDSFLETADVRVRFQGHLPHWSLERPLTGISAGRIMIPVGPLKTVDSIKYIDADGTQQTVDPSIYVVIKGDERAYIVPAYGQVWPVTRLVPNAVEVNFTVGYGDAATDVPETVRIAMKFVASYLYENPLPEADAQTATDTVFRNLLAGYRWFA